MDRNEQSAQRISNALKWLESALTEWRRSGAYGDLSLTVHFADGQVTHVTQCPQRISK